MKRFSVILILIITCTAVLYGCTSGGENKMKSSYEQITPAEAKAIMDEKDGYVILDVRTQEEFDEAHIDGAILIPDYEIADKAESVLKDKNQLILVYCRSGRRSKNAASELVSLGYTNVKEFGGIIDWPYGTV
ncbi:MAG: rhodanese-like domain-containing protein [Ruminococcaceae bacterium]|nr:rhodanese-like domain-containing protein [Oscillospiraceae bacterium]